MFNKKSVDFFESQFQRQVRDQEYALNPFEILALDYVKGSVLDLGCGLGNLSLEAGRRGHRVVAVDASLTAVARINTDAEREGLPVRGVQADIESWTIDDLYDTIVVIGLLMFFRHETALKLLTAIQKNVKPGGRAIVNVLIKGTTYLGMFDPDNYCLFRRNELEERFDGWTILKIAHPDVPCSRGHAQRFFDHNRREAKSKELKNFSNDLRPNVPLPRTDRALRHVQTSSSIYGSMKLDWFRRFWQLFIYSARNMELGVIIYRLRS